MLFHETEDILNQPALQFGRNSMNLRMGIVRMANFGQKNQPMKAVGCKIGLGKTKK